MVGRRALLALLLSLAAAPARAQQPAPPQPLAAPPMPPAAAPANPDSGRIFCDQSVTYNLAPRSAVDPPYRPFIGAWSDAAWTPQSCAALVVENVRPDGTAAILYAYGPQAPESHGAGGVLHGTGVIRNGELRFQNADGSQFAFRRLYADMQGRLTTPKGQVLQAVFKATP